MLDRNHNYKVEKKLKDFVKNDRARIQIGRISNFGLLELSRQRLKVTAEEQISVKCDYCNGSGSNLTSDFLITQIMRTYSEVSYDKPKDKIYIFCNNTLSNKIIEIKQKKKLRDDQLRIKTLDSLRSQDFLLCKENEIIVKNCHINIDIEEINKAIRTKKPRNELSKNNELEKRVSQKGENS